MTGKRRESSARNAYLLRTYGITESQYEKLLKDQGGNCAICERPATVFKCKLAVDHNHRTKEIRGLLCTFCNRRVIGRHSDPALFLKAYHYLLSPTGLFVPDRKKKKPKVRRKRK